MIGATVAPPLIAWLALAHGWRAAFVTTGAAGFVWLALWLSVYPREKSGDAGRTREPTAWRAILRDPGVWGLAIARLIGDPVWYFYLFWFPKCLGEDRGLPLIAIAQLAWLVYLAADVGSVGGGWLSGLLIRRGVAPPRRRLIVMGWGAAIAPLGMMIAAHPAIPLMLALGALVAFAHMLFQINMGALIVDVYPVRRVATIFGIIAAGSGLGGLLSTSLVAALAGSGVYSRVFLLMGLLHPLAWLVASRAVHLSKAFHADPDGVLLSRDT